MRDGLADHPSRIAFYDTLVADAAAVINAMRGFDAGISRRQRASASPSRRHTRPT